MCEVFTDHVDAGVVDANEPDVPLPGNVGIFILVVDKRNLLLVFE